MPTDLIKQLIALSRGSSDSPAAQEGTESEGPVGPGELADLTRLAATNLPAEYQALLKRHRSICLFDGSLQLYSPFQIARMHGIELPLRLIVGPVSDPRETRVLPIGGDGGETTFLLGLDGSEAGKLFSWCSGSEVTYGSASAGFELLAANLSAFLQDQFNRWSGVNVQ